MAGYNTMPAIAYGPPMPMPIPMPVAEAYHGKVWDPRDSQDRYYADTRDKEASRGVYYTANKEEFYDASKEPGIEGDGEHEEDIKEQECYFGDIMVMYYMDSSAVEKTSVCQKCRGSFKSRNLI